MKNNNSNNSIPPDSYQFVCPLDYGILPDIEYLLLICSQENGKNPKQKFLKNIAQAMTGLSDLNSEPIVSP